jgi:hypothetical protein
MSGVWEKLVRTLKRSLKAIVGKDLVNEEVLYAVFTEAASPIRGRSHGIR